MEGQGKGHSNALATSPRPFSPFKNQSGQVIVEYILLLIIAVAAATLITKRLVGRNPDNPGVITTAWSRMNDTIGSDIAD
jgi:hypothetical protein